MVTTALMAFLHHLLAFSLTACLNEFIAYRRNMGLAEIRRIQRVDLVYGISAGLLLLIGFCACFSSRKGINFYLNNPFFW